MQRVVTMLYCLLLSCSYIVSIGVSLNRGFFVVCVYVVPSSACAAIVQVAEADILEL